MWPKLTPRRAFGGSLLLLGALFLGLGTWQQSSALALLGIAWWIAILVGLAVHIIRRINAVMQLSTFNQSDIQQLRAAQDKSAGKLKGQAKDFERLASKLDALRGQLNSDHSDSATWRSDYSDQITGFRSQFAEFVAYIGEWMAIAEAETKKGVRAIEAKSQQIDSILNSVNSIVPAHRTELARARVESVKEVEAILQLRAFLEPDKLMPLLGGWAMEPVAMLGVVNELFARQPELVLECGSGASTLWIAKALQRTGKGRIVSLEHLEEYHAATSRALLASGLAGCAEVCLTPLQTHRIGKGQFEWYDFSRVDLPENSVDFLLIDGPPQATGPLARYPALPLLESLLADSAVIILDDANRPAEMEEIVRWINEYPGLQELGQLGERTKMFAYSKPGPSQKRGAAHR